MKSKLILAVMLLSGLAARSQNGTHITPAGQTGFNTATPNNKVEITSDTGDPYFGGSSGSSGLRLTNMNNTKVPATNPTSGVLSVDSVGDVIFVADQSGSGAYGEAQNGCSDNGSNVVELGNVLGGTSGKLLSDREIPLSNFGLLFSGNHSSGRIKIGGTSLTNIARLDVEHHLGTSAGAQQIGFRSFSDAAGATYNKAILAETQDPSGGSSPLNVAIHAKTKGIGAQIGIKVDSESLPNSNLPNTGIDVKMYNSASSTGDMLGVKITAGSANSKINNLQGISATAGPAISVHGGYFESWQPGLDNIKSIGVEGMAGNGPRINIGVSGGGSCGTNSGQAGNPILNYGGKFTASGGNGIANVSCINNMGIYAYALSPSGVSFSNNYGFYARAYNNVGAQCTNYGIWAEASSPNGSQVSWAGWFDGDVKIDGTNGSGTGYALNVIGDALSTVNWTVSDKRFKANIKQLEKTSEKLKRLNGYTYNFKITEFKDKKFNDREQIGFIAQELKEVFPQLIQEDKDGYMAVNYQGMIPVLLEGFKEQQAQIEAQQQQIKELKELVNTLLQNSATGNKNSAAGNQTGANGSAPTTINLTDKNIIVLNQNVPNPFAESTEITYNIPQSFTKAQLIFSTNDGKVIKVVDITEKGSGSFSIFANDLSHGIYSYKLVVDEKIIDSKRMVKE